MTPTHRYWYARIVLGLASIFIAFVFMLGAYFSVTPTDFNGDPNSATDRILGGMIFILLIGQVIAAVWNMRKNTPKLFFYLTAAAFSAQVLFYALALTFG